MPSELKTDAKSVLINATDVLNKCKNAKKNRQKDLQGKKSFCILTPSKSVS